MIILDENVEEYWIQLIKIKKYEYFSIKDNYAGISDKEVIEITKKYKGLLITEDKDFGELVFSYGLNGVSVLFLRYDQPNYKQIEKSVIKCIQDFHNSLENYFITITKNKIRFRKI